MRLGEATPAGVGSGPLFVADFGGTRVRMAAWDGQRWTGIVQITHGGEADPVHWLRQGLRALQISPARAAIAVAGPVRGGRVAWTNRPWALDEGGLAEALGIERVVLLNDVEAVAWALPHLREDQTSPCGPTGRPEETAPKAVISVGTGLGQALWWGAVGRAWSTEGGHVALAPTTPDETALWRALGGGDRRISAEEVLSGPGLVRVAHAWAVAAGERPRWRRAEEVVCDDSDLAQAACSRVATWLMRHAGDLALSTGARGGILLTGGLVDGLSPWLADARTAFDAKGAMQAWVSEVPVSRVVAPWVALVGACCRAGVVPASWPEGLNGGP